jgi:hypothetical protein
MKSYLKTLSITTASAFFLMSGASFAADPAEIEEMQADCMAKAEEMQAANLPDAEQALKDCLTKVDEMKADGEGAAKTE